MKEELASIRGLMDPVELDVLTSLAAFVPHTQAIVEIGSYTGLSASHMALAASEGEGAHIVCIDPWLPPRPNSRDDFYDIGPDGPRKEYMYNMDRMGLWGQVTALRSTSTEVAKIWMQPVGLLFIDAIHQYKEVREDYEAWEPFVVHGGWLAMHDYNEKEYPGVGQVIREVIEDSGKWRKGKLTRSLWVAQRR